MSKPYELTIGMAVYEDYERACFTIQALRWYQDIESVEFVIIASKEDQKLKEFAISLPDTRFIEHIACDSTAQPRNMIFAHASGKAVLVIDPHVLLAPGSIARLKQHYRDNPNTLDLYQGPMVYENLDAKQADNMWSPVWGSAMLGVFTGEYYGDQRTEPHEIVAQGLGLFSCLRSSWLGFNILFNGFGGEECYIHEKYRNVGRKCWCLPWLLWWHHSVRKVIPYDNTYEGRIRNYAIGWAELGLSQDPMAEYMKSLDAVKPDDVDKIIAKAIAECTA